MTKHIVKQRNIGMWVESGLYCVDQGPRTNWCMYNLLGVLMMFEYTLDISPSRKSVRCTENKLKLNLKNYWSNYDFYYLLYFI